MADERGADARSWGYWYGRRRYLPLVIAAVAYNGLVAMSVHRTGTSLLAVAVMECALVGAYRLWTAPAPTLLATRLEQWASEPRFGPSREDHDAV